MRPETRILSKIIMLLLAVIFTLLPLSAEEETGEKIPPWVPFEQAKLEFLNKEYGKALKLLKSVIDDMGDFPEAEMLIGDIYLTEGEYVLAEKQYLKAFSQKDFLDVEEDKYVILYKLITLYRHQERYKNYEDTLIEVLNENQDYYNKVYTRYQDPFEKIYSKEGLNRFLKLYRINDTFASRVHRELGWFYYKTGRYQTSLLHSLFAMNIVLSEAIKQYRIVDPEFEYESLEGFLELALQVPVIRDYLVHGEQIFQILYYLAGSTYAQGRLSDAEYIWQVVEKNKYSGKYGQNSAKQLVNPWLETYLNFGSVKLEQALKSHSGTLLPDSRQ